MAHQTPTANQWPSTTHSDADDEIQPLLCSNSQPQPISKLPTRNVISKKTHQDKFIVDHGFSAWLQVLCGWILFMNSWGLPNSFGAFQTFYVKELIPEQSAASVAWIGSIQLFLTTLGCLFGGIFLDRGYLQSLIAVGTGLEVVGLLATSFSTKYWQLLLAQGVCVGLGSGLLALFPITVISMYFEKKRMVAVGIASTGASFTGILYPIVLRYLFTKVGFPWAVRFLVLFILATNAIPMIAMRLQSEGKEGGSKLSLHHFKDPTYSVFVATFTLLTASVTVPFFFIPEYALKLGIEETMAFNLLAVMNAANLFGRLVPSFVADRYGGMSTLLPLTFICTISLIVLPLITATPLLPIIPTLVVFSLFYGFAAGSVMILPAPIIVNLSPISTDLGVRMGLAHLCAAFGGLIGNPISGAVKKEGYGNGDVGAVQEFKWLWWTAALIMGSGMLLLGLARRLRTGSWAGQSVA
ncbi:MFS general substrate transporter [Massarina eburnea CBS 473.64]|uniref:MFS general substrate transporter n=1 Tax=Massarina eburnea CBS 473.64 TaxID=1395130 RepID=A0A6A6SFL3_9PLEO|nr:MFS general substrate transporter [Massarina eburnea CBS 473.64]